jgi:hypothetical protein
MNEAGATLSVLLLERLSNRVGPEIRSGVRVAEKDYTDVARALLRQLAECGM